MSRFIILILLISVLFAAAVTAEKPEVISQIRLKPMTKQQYLDVRTSGFDIKEMRGEVVEVFASPGDLQRLRQAGIEWEVIHPNLQEFYVLRATAENFGGFLTFSQIEAKLDELHSTYPAITTEKFSIGNSIEYRDLWAMKISDSPGVDEDEAEVLYISLIHAREPIGPAAVLHFMEYLLAGYGVDPEITDIVDNRELFFVPMQNPDGYVYNEMTNPNGGGMWRKNRRPNSGDQPTS